MAKRPKRFFEGGMDEKEPGWESKEASADSKSPTNFKSAFAAARSAGDKTFEFGGKKYTTELAGSKPAPKTESEPETKSTSAPVTAKTESTSTPVTAKTESASTPVSAKKETYRDFSGNIQTKKSTADKGDSIGTFFSKALKNREERLKRDKEQYGFSKGGTASSRADGIAQRGKTRGTMAAMCGGGMAKGKR